MKKQICAKEIVLFLKQKKTSIKKMTLLLEKTAITV